MNPPRLYDYLTRSRTIMLDAAEALTPEQYAREFPIGLGSLARTLHHMMAAEWLYMERIRGRTGRLGELGREHDPEPAEPFALPELRAHWDAQAEQTAADLASVTDWEGPIKCITTDEDGSPLHYSAARAEFFAQLLTHEVHHRAQALNILRRLDIGVGEIDYSVMMYLFEGR